MAIFSFKSLNKTVSISYNSVNIQRDIISSLTPAVSMPCLDFAFPIPAQTSVHSKIFFREKFRSYTTEPVFELGYSIDGLEDLTPEKCIDICLSVEGTDLIFNLVVF